MTKYDIKETIMPKLIPILQNAEWLREQYKTKTTRQIAKEIGSNPTSVANALRRHSIPIREAKRPGPKQLFDREWLTEQYKTKTAKEIAEEIGCSAGGVIGAMRRLKIKMRETGRKRISPLLNDPIWLKEQYATYGSAHKIAAILKCSQVTVSKALQKAKIAVNGISPTPLRKYNKIKNKDGKMQPEHRVVMEEHLGRKLQSNEHVHHINGNTLDNSLTNLIVLTRSEHSKIHALHSLRRCIICKDIFNSNHSAKYCKNCNPRLTPR